MTMGTGNLNNITDEDIAKFPPRSPLITEPLSYHPIDQILERCRAALAAGADPNAPDTMPVLPWNEGRPLDACLRQTHMPGKKSIIENLPVIELLIEHGADPRLFSKSVGVACIPMKLARHYAEDEEEGEKGLAFWKRVLELFEEAIVKLDAKKPFEQDLSGWVTE